MRVTRIYVSQPLQPAALVSLPEAQARHLVRVLRLDAGAGLVAFDGRGGEYAATMERVHRGSVAIRIGAHDAVERESPLDVTLLQGIARGEKMDLILQKATELGVTRIVPLSMMRSTVRLTADTAARRVEHWQGVVAGACEQCGRNRVPAVESPVAFADAVKLQRMGVKLLLSPAADAAAPRLLLDGQPGAAVVLLIGPEGGFDPVEARLARDAGFRDCRLGPRVLRTETAALAALAALQAIAGDFSR